MNSDIEKSKSKIRSLLAEYLGVEPDDIEDDSILSEDLHMQASDLTDFVEIIGKNGFETDKLDLTEIESVEDLFNAVIE